MPSGKQLEEFLQQFSDASFLVEVATKAKRKEKQL
jgi:hypothetical protein